MPDRIMTALQMVTEPTARLDDTGTVLDGVNDDGCYGWQLVLRHGVLECHSWDSESEGALVEPMTEAHWIELFGSSWREYPEMPGEPGQHPAYRSAAAMQEWRAYLELLRDGNMSAKPPAWFRPRTEH